MDTAQWPQGIGLVNYKATEAAATAAKPMLENNNNINTSKRSSPSSSSSPRSQQIKNHQPLNCPRCNSTNTKFCYYNNYSLSQPRYFCKTCRRYWTEGGSLRNVPVGGGSRKNKRFSSSSPSILSKVNINRPDFASADPHQNNPRLIHYDQTPTLSHDLNLTYPPPPIINPHHQNHDHHHHDYNHYPYDHHHQHHQIQNPNIDAPTPRGFFSSIFMPTVTVGSGLDPNTIYSSGFNIPLQEFKPATLNFSLDGDGLSSAIGSSRAENERVLFPAGEGVNNNNKSTSTGTATTTTNDNFEQKEDSVAVADAAGGNWNNNINNNNNNNNGEMLGGELTW